MFQSIDFRDDGLHAIEETCPLPIRCPLRQECCRYAGDNRINTGADRGESRAQHTILAEPRCRRILSTARHIDTDQVYPGMFLGRSLRWVRLTAPRRHGNAATGNRRTRRFYGVARLRPIQPWQSFPLHPGTSCLRPRPWNSSMTAGMAFLNSAGVMTGKCFLLQNSTYWR